MKKILVAGASGHLGGYVIKGLDERGHWIRALIRDAAHVRSIEGAIEDTFFRNEARDVARRVRRLHR